VAEQDRVSRAFAELETDGFGLIDLRGGLSLGGRYTLPVAVEDLLDASYSEHLNRRNRADGSPLLEPGRNLHVMLGVGF